MVGHRGDSGGTSVSDAFRLLFATEPEHRMKSEGAAQPLRFHREDIEIQRKIGRGNIGVAFGGALFDDAPNIALTALELVDLSVVTQLRGPGADLRPAEFFEVLFFG